MKSKMHIMMARLEVEVEASREFCSGSVEVLLRWKTQKDQIIVHSLMVLSNVSLDLLAGYCARQADPSYEIES